MKVSRCPNVLWRNRPKKRQRVVRSLRILSHDDDLKMYKCTLTKSLGKGSFGGGVSSHGDTVLLCTILQKFFDNQQVLPWRKRVLTLIECCYAKWITFSFDWFALQALLWRPARKKESSESMEECNDSEGETSMDEQELVWSESAERLCKWNKYGWAGVSLRWKCHMALQRKEVWTSSRCSMRMKKSLGELQALHPNIWQPAKEHRHCKSLAARGRQNSRGD